MKSVTDVLRQKINRYAFWLACLILASVGIGLAFLQKDLGWRVALSNIGLNLFASVVFAIIFSWLSTRNQEKNLLETLNEQFGSQVRAIDGQIHRLSTAYLPAKTYPASAGFGEDFNRDITESLSRSTQYSFRGTSAKYVPARLRHAKKRPTTVRIFMLDPSGQLSTLQRAADRQMQTPLKDQPVAALAEDVRNEVCMSLVALFDVREICPIDILVVDRPVITRLELFDDAAYLAFYQGTDSPPYPFPHTARFERGSFNFEVEHLAIARTFEGSDAVMRFDRRHTDNDLIVYLTRYTKNPATPEMLDQLRQDYKKFIAPFESHLAALA